MAITEVCKIGWARDAIKQENEKEVDGCDPALPPLSFFFFPTVLFLCFQGIMNDNFCLLGCQCQHCTDSKWADEHIVSAPKKF